MVHSAGDDGPQVIVTTRGLVDRWLRAQSTEKDADLRLPADLDAALREDNFYTFAVAKTPRSARPPSSRSPSRPAPTRRRRARRLRPDIGPNPRQEIVVTLQKEARLYRQPGRQDRDRQDRRLRGDLERGDEEVRGPAQRLPEIGSKDEKLFDDRTKAEDEGDKAYRACLVAKTPQQPYYAALVKEAQELADRLAAN